MTTVRIILIALFAALSSNLFTEEYYFKHFNTSNNLPDNSVTCIVQDTHGFIYVGTKSGVTWLDGNTFRRVESDKGQDILNSMIQTRCQLGDCSSRYATHIAGFQLFKRGLLSPLINRLTS